MRVGPSSSGDARRPDHPPSAARSAVSRSFPPDPHSVPKVRTMVRELLGGRRQAWHIEVVAAELAGNAVRHAHTDFTVVFSVLDDRVLIEVFDGSVAPASMRQPTGTQIDGRGLLVVDRLAFAWGAEQTSEGKRVWAELPLTSPES